MIRGHQRLSRRSPSSEFLMEMARLYWAESLMHPRKSSERGRLASIARDYDLRSRSLTAMRLLEV